MPGTQQEAPAVFASYLHRDAVTADFICPIYKETYPAGATACQKQCGVLLLPPFLCESYG